MSGADKPEDIKKYLLYIGMSEMSINDMSLKPGDHEFFVKVHDDWEKSMKDEIRQMLSLHSKETHEHISNTYDQHAKIICDVVREMLVEQSVSMEKLINSVVAKQNEEIFKKIDSQNKIIREIQKIITAQQKELTDHEKRIRILEKKLADLMVQHNKHHQ